MTVVEICAGGGGQALGLELAGFHHVASVEIDADACRTLKANRPAWTVLNEDLQQFSGTPYRGTDLLAGGVPCPPFSIAGKQLGPKDERDLFPDALRLVEQIAPRAVMLENVRGLSSERFTPYREKIFRRLVKLGYEVRAQLLQASDFGVPQLRPRYIIVALRPEFACHFKWPKPVKEKPTVAHTIGNMIGSRGWPGTDAWMRRADAIGPTIVGGSKKHGGPDLGPTRARKEWAALGVDGKVIAADAPGADFPTDGMPRLTVRMVARIQGFPDEWQFTGNKTASYRQVGNAFPPPVAKAVGQAIRAAIVRGLRDQQDEAGEQVPLIRVPA